jgi:hypothetical protein
VLPPQADAIASVRDARVAMARERIGTISDPGGRGSLRIVKTLKTENSELRTENSKQARRTQEREAGSSVLSSKFSVPS